METHFYWEDHLIELALKAIEQERVKSQSPPHDHELLQRAYQHCEQIIKTASKTFYLASGLLPAGKKKSIRALYAFCRVSDDIVDQGPIDMEAHLEYWRHRVLRSIQETQVDPSDIEMLVALAWKDARDRHQVPGMFIEQLVDGVSKDLFIKSYESFTELVAYCYGVACTVGLMSMHIIGHKGIDAIPYAIRLGVALQLTNILRDVGEDWQMGRVYLPRDEMEEFNISEQDIASGIVTEKWRSFMRFQIDRVRLLYASALPGIRMLHPDGRFAIAAAAELYREILTGIENNNYDVFSRRAAASSAGKIRQLPGIWQRARSGKYPEFQMPVELGRNSIRGRLPVL